MFTDVNLDNAKKVIELGRLSDMTFFETDPKDWKLTPFDFTDFTIPTEGIKRLNKMLSWGYPVEAVYLAHEVETQPEVKPFLPWVVPGKPEVKPKVEPVATPKDHDIDWKAVAAVVGAVLGVIGLIFTVLLFGALCSSDPAIIVKIQGRYLMIYSWLEVKNELAG